MPIQRSAGAEIRPLLDALGGPDDTRREAAVARLAVIGPRAVEHLLQEFRGATAQARNGILRTLEAIGDPRAMSAALEGLQDSSPAVQIAAVGTLRALVASPAAAHRDAFDRLVSLALDGQRAAAVRIAAWEAIRETAGMSVQSALAGDSDPVVRAAAANSAAPTAESDVWTAATDGRLPLAPALLKEAIAAHKTRARLTELQRMIDLVRAREQQEADVQMREEWRAVRGALHQALAARNSRLALYDLRDSLLGPERLPVAFLAAIEEIGDATCLDTLAAAYEASSRSGDTWWREHVASAFRAIVQREGLTRRHSVVKRVLARWSEAGELLR